MASTSLTLDNLTLPKEKTYFWIAAVFSAVIWVFLILFLVFIGPLLALIAWLANGLLIARLKAESVKVDAEQLPDLHKAFLEVCGKLQSNTIPDLYVLQSGGILNAFATRHSGRNFVVLYSDVVEAYGADSDEIRFIIGHEIGHIQRRHLIKHILLAPGLFLPLLGHAYSRACEASCDRFGAYATENIDGALWAMMKLSGGKTAALAMNPDQFASQYHKDRGFFISWHELISGYPTLSQRMANLVAIRDNTPAPRASRHPLAYFFAMFGAGSSTGQGGGFLSTIFVIALLMGLALPAMESATKKAHEVQEQARIRNEASVQMQDQTPPTQQTAADKEEDKADAPVAPAAKAVDVENR